jgi:Penicillin-binding protein-related factor A, putative recombinase
MAIINYANRGKALEYLINYANMQYLNKGVALVRYIPTEWSVTRQGTRIISAFPVQKSSVDYIGITNFKHKTVPLAFDAKQCKEKTSFPLSNIEQHQIDYLADWSSQGGTSFFLIEMVALDKIFRVELNEIMQYWEAAKAGGRKSIPFADFNKFQAVGWGGGILLDYLGMYS